MKSLDNPFTYAGYYYDVETNNYYLLSRYYNPTLARFINEDTHKGELNDPLSLNKYVYVNNNPMIYYDPDGQAPIPLITSILGGLFGTGTTFVQDLVDDGKINTDWKKYVGNTIQGAATGFGFGLCGTACGGIGGYIGNVANQAIESYTTTGAVTINQKEAVVNGLTTTVAGFVFGVGGNDFGKGAMNYFAHYGTKSLLSGYAADVTYQFADKGFTSDSKGNITGYDFNNALMNYDSKQSLKTGLISMVLAPPAAKVNNWAISAYGMPKGMRSIEVNGKKVIQNDKLINPNRVDSKTGLTNRQLMEQGKAPYGPDGQRINLHHVDQTNSGPVKEITATEHQKNYNSLHHNTGNLPSQIDRNTFKNWRINYWKNR